MTVGQRIRAIAGTFVLASLAPGYFVSPCRQLSTAFVGANPLQSALTRWCPMETFLAWPAGASRRGRSSWHFGAGVCRTRATPDPAGRHTV
ncbi:MAG: DUF2892 domain-containing protein [Isosphaera sp.]|nr:DUF2892 domain-containing protein [Isosphaera sp.]